METVNASKVHVDQPIAVPAPVNAPMDLTVPMVFVSPLPLATTNSTAPHTDLFVKSPIVLTQSRATTATALQGSRARTTTTHPFVFPMALENAPKTFNVLQANTATSLATLARQAAATMPIASANAGIRPCALVTTTDNVFPTAVAP